jgi:hypothetical protein
MTEKQALDVIKQIIDLAIQRGNFQNAETVSVALQAYQTLIDKFGEEKK